MKISITKYSILYIFALSALFMGCSDEYNDEYEPILMDYNFITDTIKFNKETALQQSLTVPFSESWTAKVSSNWISLSDYSGTGEKQITVSVTKNDNNNSRTGTVEFSSRKKTLLLNVTQSGKHINMISSSLEEISAMGGTLSLSFSSSIDVKGEIEYQSTATDWIKIKKIDNDTCQIQVEFNPSINIRIASVKISPINSALSNKEGIIYTIVQLGRRLDVDATTIYTRVAINSKSKSVHITCDGSYSIDKDDYWDNSWYTIIPNNYENSFYVIRTGNNYRDGKVIISLTELPQGESKNVSVYVSDY